MNKSGDKNIQENKSSVMVEKVVINEGNNRWLSGYRDPLTLLPGAESSTNEARAVVKANRINLAFSFLSLISLHIISKEIIKTPVTIDISLHPAIAISKSTERKVKYFSEDVPEDFVIFEYKIRNIIIIIIPD